MLRVTALGSSAAKANSRLKDKMVTLRAVERIKRRRSIPSPFGRRLGELPVDAAAAASELQSLLSKRSSATKPEWLSSEPDSLVIRCPTHRSWKETLE